MVASLNKEMRYRHLENSKQCQPGVNIVFNYGRKENTSLKNTKRGFRVRVRRVRARGRVRARARVRGRVRARLRFRGGLRARVRARLRLPVRVRVRFRIKVNAGVTIGKK